MDLLRLEAALVASFAVEVAGRPAAGHWLRAAVILVWFALETPVFRRAKERTTRSSRFLCELAATVPTTTVATSTVAAATIATAG